LLNAAGGDTAIGTVESCTLCVALAAAALTGGVGAAPESGGVSFAFAVSLILRIKSCVSCGIQLGNYSGFIDCLASRFSALTDEDCTQSCCDGYRSSSGKLVCRRPYETGKASADGHSCICGCDAKSCRDFLAMPPKGSVACAGTQNVCTDGRCSQGLSTCGNGFIESKGGCAEQCETAGAFGTFGYGNATGCMRGQACDSQRCQCHKALCYVNSGAVWSRPGVMDMCQNGHFPSGFDSTSNYVGACAGACPVGQKGRCVASAGCRSLPGVGVQSAGGIIDSSFKDHPDWDVLCVCE
jgi:hypothetical protein